MRVRDWMSPDPVTVEPSSTVRRAGSLLRDYGIRHLPVVERGRVVGMLSDRDVTVAESALDHAGDAPRDRGTAELEAAPALTVRSIMSAPAHVIDDEEPIEAAARLMLSRRISALPVLADGVLVGVITTTDCLLASLSPPAPPEAAAPLLLP